MKNKNLWIYLSIIICILASVRIALRKILSHIDLDKDIIAAILECIIGLFGFIYLLLNYKRINLNKINNNNILNFIVIAFFTLISSILVIYTLSLTNNTSSIVSIINFNVVLTLLISILYFKEKINIYTFTGIFMSFVGLILIVNYHDVWIWIIIYIYLNIYYYNMIQLWIFFAILSMIISALSTISLKIIDNSKYENDIFIMLTYIIMAFFSIVYLFLFQNDKNKIIKSCDKQLLFFVILFGLLLIINHLCMQYAMKITPNIGYSHLIINLNVIITLFASYFLFKQKINFQSFIGIIIAILGIAIVVNSSN